MLLLVAVVDDAGRGIHVRAGMLSARGGLEDTADDIDDDATVWCDDLADVDLPVLGAAAGDWNLLAIVLWPMDPPKLLTSSPPPPSRLFSVSSRSRMAVLDTGVPLVPRVDIVT